MRKVEGSAVGVWTVAGVTFANGGDNIASRPGLPQGPAAVVAYGIVSPGLAALVGLV